MKEAYPIPAIPTAASVIRRSEGAAPGQGAVTLAAIKAEPKLADLALVRQSRLSVVPVAEPEWKLLCKMAQVPA